MPSACSMNTATSKAYNPWKMGGIISMVNLCNKDGFDVTSYFLCMGDASPCVSDLSRGTAHKPMAKSKVLGLRKLQLCLLWSH